MMMFIIYFEKNIRKLKQTTNFENQIFIEMINFSNKLVFYLIYQFFVFLHTDLRFCMYSSCNNYTLKNICRDIISSYCVSLLRLRRSSLFQDGNGLGIPSMLCSLEPGILSRYLSDENLCVWKQLWNISLR